MPKTNSIIADHNGESWLAVENNVIHIFVSKNSLVNYYHNTESTRTIKLFHRYADGELSHLLFYSNEPKSIQIAKTPEYVGEISDRPLMDQIEEQYRDEIEYYEDEYINFYDMVAANDEVTLEPKTED